IDHGATLGQYTYDPFGRRLSKTVNGVTTWFHYDDTGLLAEYSASGQLLNEYQYRPGSTWMTNPLFKRDGATGKVHYYYNSHLGQPLKLFDKAGKITWAARSQAFGQTTVFVNETENNLRFPGQYEDGESGLFYNYHRYYDAQVGRYLQSDPAGFVGGLNTYLYVNSSPLEFIDPLGLFCSPILNNAIAGAVGGALTGFLSGGPAGILPGLIAGGLTGAVSGMAENSNVGDAAGAAVGAAIGYAAAQGKSSKVTAGGKASVYGSIAGYVGAAATSNDNEDMASAVGGFTGGVVSELANSKRGPITNIAKAFRSGPAGLAGGLVESALKKKLSEHCSENDGSSGACQNL
ncbi:RHS domain-containing protein, partial [Candidatus Kaiserbacteria bacterium]|nr:RHS domain-containing protein [Candidatus Kaiserbacteria bacterium]